jgi:hypothetical protein
MFTPRPILVALLSAAPLLLTSTAVAQATNYIQRNPGQFFSVSVDEDVQVQLDDGHYIYVNYTLPDPNVSGQNPVEAGKAPWPIVILVPQGGTMKGDAANWQQAFSIAEEGYCVITFDKRANPWSSAYHEQLCDPLLPTEFQDPGCRIRLTRLREIFDLFAIARSAPLYPQLEQVIDGGNVGVTGFSDGGKYTWYSVAFSGRYQPGSIGSVPASWWDPQVWGDNFPEIKCAVVQGYAPDFREMYFPRNGGDESVTGYLIEDLYGAIERWPAAIRSAPAPSLARRIFEMSETPTQVGEAYRPYSMFGPGLAGSSWKWDFQYIGNTTASPCSAPIGPCALEWLKCGTGAVDWPLLTTTPPPPTGYTAYPDGWPFIGGLNPVGGGPLYPVLVAIEPAEVDEAKQALASKNPLMSQLYSRYFDLQWDVILGIEGSSVPYLAMFSYDDRVTSTESIVDHWQATAGAAGPDRRLLLTTGHHGSAPNQAAARERDVLRARWFDKYLKGMDNGVEDEELTALVTPDHMSDFYPSDGTYLWDRIPGLTAADLDPASKQKYYLNSQASPTLSDQYSTQNGSDRVDLNWATATLPVFLDPSLVQQCGTTKNRYTSIRADLGASGGTPIQSSHVFETDPFSGDTLLFGEIDVRLVVSSDDDFQLHVGFYDIPPPEDDPQLQQPDRFITSATYTHRSGSLDKETIAFESRIASYVMRDQHKLLVKILPVAEDDYRIADNGKVGTELSYRVMPLLDTNTGPMFKVDIWQGGPDGSSIAVPIRAFSTPRVSTSYPSYKRNKLADASGRACSSEGCPPAGMVLTKGAFADRMEMIVHSAKPTVPRDYLLLFSDQPYDPLAPTTQQAVFLQQNLPFGVGASTIFTDSIAGTSGPWINQSGSLDMNGRSDFPKTGPGSKSPAFNCRTQSYIPAGGSLYICAITYDALGHFPQSGDILMNASVSDVVVIPFE